MGYEGRFDHYKCDGCGRTTHVPQGYDINQWPLGTNQRWWDDRKETLCPSCFKKPNSGIYGKFSTYDRIKED